MCSIADHVKASQPYVTFMHKATQKGWDYDRATSAWLFVLERRRRAVA